MSQPPQTQRLSFERTAVYRIIVQGVLHEDYSDYLGGMQIAQRGQGQTVLFGQLQDQVALIGVLNALIDLHLPLVAVEFLGLDESE